MADSRSRSFRLRPSEHRLLLILGDLVASIAAVFAGLHIWKLFIIRDLVNSKIRIEQFQRLLHVPFWFFLSAGYVNGILNDSFVRLHIPLWFYLLPFGWLLLMIDLYEPHVAADWRKTLRGIGIA